MPPTSHSGSSTSSGGHGGSSSHYGSSSSSSSSGSRSHGGGSVNTSVQQVYGPGQGSDNSRQQQTRYTIYNTLLSSTNTLTLYDTLIFPTNTPPVSSFNTLNYKNQSTSSHYLTTIIFSQHPLSSIRHARRLYVGGLPSGAQEEDLLHFFTKGNSLNSLNSLTIVAVLMSTTSTDFIVFVYTPKFTINRLPLCYH